MVTVPAIVRVEISEPKLREIVRGALKEIQLHTEYMKLYRVWRSGDITSDEFLCALTDLVNGDIRGTREMVLDKAAGRG